MPTDLKILQTLQECGPAPVPVFLLAERSGLPVDRMTLRMKSLVSLRYVERLAVAEAEAYAPAPAATCPSLAPLHVMTGAPVPHALEGIQLRRVTRHLRDPVAGAHRLRGRARPGVLSAGAEGDGATTGH
ncbi:MAG TPA: hypothetical protein VG370_30165 [Chloroflexota bacterium]|nr:hypothetical protein [Chloroflexota bacterium]